MARIRNVLIGVAAMAALVYVAAYSPDVLITMLRVLFNLF